eukprot:COSAG02_NODE_768_length_17375_cov_52.865015_13_plen_49_part_00
MRTCKAESERAKGAQNGRENEENGETDDANGVASVSVFPLHQLVSAPI